MTPIPLKLLELRIGVSPLLGCIHIGRALIIRVGEHGDHCEYLMSWVIGIGSMEVVSAKLDISSESKPSANLR